jgi:glucose-1-phosphate adenylyltransferase
MLQPETFIKEAHMAHPRILAFVLAGGKGERLFPLTEFRSKPAVPFGGRYRITDFVLSNMINSRIYSLYLLVQYKSQSLIEHVRQNWNMSPLVRDHFVTVVPPQMRMGPDWFQGTADAVFQNINLIHDHDPEIIAVFGSDHIYRMDIRQMIDFHMAKDAIVTVAARPVPKEQASAFGIIVADRDRRITGFQEKPKQNPAPMPDDPDRVYASMGNYIFSTKALIGSLLKAQERKQHDFGAHIIPGLLETRKVYAYDFAENSVPGTMPYEDKGYWRDVGTLSAYFDAHLDMLGEQPKFELRNRRWPIHPPQYDGPAAKIISGDIRNSVIAEGVVINGARIVNSTIRKNVVIEEDVSVEDSIIMDHTVLQKGCRLRRVIVDKFNSIDPGVEIGFDREKDREYCGCYLDRSGVAVLSKGERLMRRIKGFR